MSMANDFNWTADSNATFKAVAVYQTPTAPGSRVYVAANLTGYTATMIIGPAFSSAVATLTLTVGNGITIDAAAGLITVRMTVAQSRTVFGAAVDGKVCYTLDITPSGGENERILRGRIFVLAGVLNS